MEQNKKQKNIREFTDNTLESKLTNNKIWWMDMFYE
jgi:hypothetical protein